VTTQSTRVGIRRNAELHIRTRASLCLKTTYINRKGGKKKRKKGDGKKERRVKYTNVFPMILFFYFDKVEYQSPFYSPIGSRLDSEVRIYSSSYSLKLKKSVIGSFLLAENKNRQGRSDVGVVSDL